MATVLAAPLPPRAWVEPRTVRWLLGLMLLMMWEALPRLGLIPSLFLPPLTETVTALVVNAGDYGRHLLFSLRAVAASLLIACGIGIGLGLLAGSITPVRRVMLPLASGLYAVPIVILYPLFTAWFGIGPQSKIAFASIYGLLPCLLGTMAGVQTIDRQYITVARSMRASRWQTISRVLLPAAILTSAEGIGYLITRYRTMLNSPRVFAGILVVVAVVFLFDGLVRLIERRTAAWRLSTRSGEPH
jgi:NitT/TauT family transport system permease protein